MALSLTVERIKLGALDLLSGAGDPTVGVAAPVGSKYFRTNGYVYVKNGAGDTAWERLVDQSFDGGNLTLSNGSLVIGTASVVTGAADPTAGSGVAAGLGSLYLRTDGTVYVKSAVGDTAWDVILDQSFTGDFTVASGDLVIGSTRIIAGSADPAAGAGVTASQGSVYLRSNGYVYFKTGVADVGWERAVDQSFDGGNLTISNGNLVVGTTSVIAGAADPTAGGGVVAGLGSLYLRTNGYVYIKTGAGDTAWERGVDQSFDGGNFTISNGNLVLGSTSIIAGSVDPTAGAGVVAGIGSKYLRTNGTEYNKTGAGDTAWTLLATGDTTSIVNTRVAYSNGSSLVGSANFTWDASGNILNLAGRVFSTVDGTNASPTYGWGTDTGFFLTAGTGVGVTYAGTTHLMVGNDVITAHKNVTPESDNARNLGSASLGWKNLYVTSNAVGTAQTAAITVENKTAATLGAQQYSPVFLMVGRGWETTGSTSQTVAIGMQIMPQQATSVGGLLAVVSSNNGAAYINRGGWWARSNAVTSFHLFNSSTGTNPASDGVLFEINSSNAYLYNREASFFSFGANNAEQLRLSSGAASIPNTTSLDLYNVGTAGDANYERLRINWATNVATIRTGAGGTGNNTRSLDVLVGDGSGIRLSTGGVTTFYGNTTSQHSVLLDSAATGLMITGRITSSTTVPAVALKNEGTGLTAAAGVQTAFQFAATANQSSTAGYDLLSLESTETTSGSGERNLINAKVGGTSRFKLQWDGTTASMLASDGTSSRMAYGFLSAANTGMRGTATTIVFGIAGNNKATISATATTLLTLLMPGATSTYDIGSSVTGWRALYIDRQSVGESTAIATHPGIVIGNSTAATAMVDQSSPFLTMQGTAWNTGSLASQTFNFAWQAEGGSANPITATLYLHTTINGTQTEVANFNNSGDLTMRRYVSAQRVSVPQTAATSGTPLMVSLSGGAHTGLTASTEAPDVTFALARTVQWATGALSAQRAIKITAPTYAFVGVSVLTDAATVAISGSPVVGANATITNRHALWVESGQATFENSNIGSSNVVGVHISNRTASTAVSTEQHSPYLMFSGSSWTVDGTPANHSYDWLVNMTGVSAGTGRGDLMFGYREDGGGVRDVVVFRHTTSSSTTTIQASSDTSTLRLYNNASSGIAIDASTVTSNLNLTVTQDLDAAGGFRRTIGPFERATPGAGTTTTLTAAGSANDAAGWIPCTRAGSCVEIAAWGNADLTVGTADVWIQKSTDGGDTWTDLWGSDASPAAVLNVATWPERFTNTVAKDTHTFAAGDILRIRLKTESAITGPATIYGMLGIEM